MIFILRYRDHFNPAPAGGQDYDPEPWYDRPTHLAIVKGYPNLCNNEDLSNNPRLFYQWHDFIWGGLN